jgi:hypothetical protein
MFVTGNLHHDHDTIAAFRRKFFGFIGSLFAEALKLACGRGLLKTETVGLDGTKVHANASRHSALSYGHVVKIQKQLKSEVADLSKKASAVDGDLAGFNRLIRLAEIWRLSARRGLKTRIGGNVTFFLVCYSAQV